MPSFVYDTEVISAKWLHEYYSKHRLEGENVFLNFTLKI